MNLKLLFLLAFCSSCLIAQDAEMRNFAAQLGAQASQAGAKTLAIVKFTNEQGYNEHLSNYLADRLARMLAAQEHQFQLESRSQVESASHELQLRYQDELTTPALRSLRAKLNADALVMGSFLVMPQSIMLDATLLDGKTLNMIGAQSVKLKREDVSTLLGIEQPSVMDRRASTNDSPITRGALPMATVNTRQVAIPAQTVIRVRVNQNLSSDRNHPNENVLASLAEPIIVNGMTVANRGADVKVIISQASPGRLSLRLESIQMFDKSEIPVSAEDYQASHGVAKGKVATGAATAATIGAILGGVRAGTRGATIGAAAGAGVGAVAGGIIGPAQVHSESIISFTVHTDVPWH